MTLGRLIISAALLSAIAFAFVWTAPAAASPAPDDAGSDCSWHENGTTIEIGQESYTCHCAQLVGPMGPQVLCRWYREDTLAAKPAKKRIPAKKRHPVKPRVRVYAKPAVVG